MNAEKQVTKRSRTALSIAAGVIVASMATGGAYATPLSPTRTLDMPRSTWAACGLFTPQSKAVASWQHPTLRASDGTASPAGTITMYCGNSRGGYVHIKQGHAREWEPLASMENRNWRDLANYAISSSLATPEVVTYRPSNQTFCVSRQVVLYDKVRGIPIKTIDPSIVYSRGGVLVTAFPGGRCGKSR